MTIDPKYLVSQPKKIIKYLNLLSQERCLISAVFGKEDKDTFLSAIIDIDKKKETLTIDCGPKEYLNKKLLDSSIIKCSSKYQGIDVKFEARGVIKAGKINSPKFILPLPKSIYWIERREFFRIRSPLSKNSFCRIYFKDPDSTHEFKIHDISLQGFSMLSDISEVSSKLSPNTTFDECTLVLNNDKELTITFDTAYKRPFISNKPNGTERIGCMLTYLTPKIESTILKYMQNIQREQKLKEK